MTLPRAIACLLAALLLAQAAAGRRFSNKPIRIVVPFGAGGVADLTRAYRRPEAWPSRWARRW